MTKRSSGTSSSRSPSSSKSSSRSPSSTPKPRSSASSSSSRSSSAQSSSSFGGFSGSSGGGSSSKNPIAAILGAIVLFIGFLLSQINSAPQPLPPVPGRDDVTAVVTVPVTRPVDVGTAVPQITPVVAQGADGLSLLRLPLGNGAQRSFWTVMYTAPSGSRDPATYIGGIDNLMATRIDAVQRTLDIAAYEFNSPALTQAVLRAHQRGVIVRMVTDDEGGMEDDDGTIPTLIAAGIPVVDDQRSALMHNKFMILDGQTVVTGSWNFTINDTYRNNNNALIIRSRSMVANYQAEFNEMFVDRQFGPRSPANTPNAAFTQDGIAIQTLFAPEDDVIGAIDLAMSAATRSIDFLAFSYTQADMGAIMAERARAGVRVRGVFERTGSETEFSQLRPLLCDAGLEVRQDGNPFVLHHKVIIIDGTTVISGSFNFSANATRSNDENLIIVRDPVLAAQYLLEFEQRYAQAQMPGITCS